MVLLKWNLRLNDGTSDMESKVDAVCTAESCYTKSLLYDSGWWYFFKQNNACLG